MTPPEPYLCACNRVVTEWLWAVKNIWYCSQECGAKAAYGVSPQTIPPPQSQASYPEVMGCGL